MRMDLVIGKWIVCRLHKHDHMISSFLGAFAILRTATISFVMCVRPSAWNSSAPTGRIFMKFDI